MTFIDYIILAIIFISAFISFFRGFIREVVSLAIWATAIYVAIHFSPTWATILQAHIKSTALAYLIAVLILFMLVLVAGMVVNFLLTLVIDKTGISMFDRLLGVLFGMARGVLLVTVLLLMLNLTSMQRDPSLQASGLAPHFAPLETWLNTLLPTEMDRFAPLKEEDAEEEGDASMPASS